MERRVSLRVKVRQGLPLEHAAQIEDPGFPRYSEGGGGQPKGGDLLIGNSCTDGEQWEVLRAWFGHGLNHGPVCAQH
eukprot:scaffold121591_cov19-Tisochrysis_lutea.AAC.2